MKVINLADHKKKEDIEEFYEQVNKLTAHLDPIEKVPGRVVNIKMITEKQRAEAIEKILKRT